ncbi:MAG: hypothetical protein A3K19_17875 [Lentisphaerae bacterium RIFOXYB12_FULL_65_16]|nr:MAG: hypothetical protein A3K18_16140 [Lentisphaerae bacterium RIFOXYA12_64_32]OGV85318.1 MAG: hypothetical protein A3K19_17875 [Lentisphaerae bacterium RIFOXYB12_FULL_65_16]
MQAVGRMKRLVLFLVLVGVTGAGFAAASSDVAASGCEVRGKVVRAFSGGPVRQGVVELRRPAEDDRYRPLQAPLQPDGTYSLRFERSAFGGTSEGLTVSVIAKGFTVSEKRLPALAPGPGRVIEVDLELSPATLDGVLDIFSCCVLSWAIVIVMLPAFFLGAAIKVFVPGHLILRHLGPNAPPWRAYGASVSAGTVLSLCSCNVIPLFLSIWRSGAGVGPAFTFLFAGPAINVVSMVFTCRVIGVGIGIWRVVAVAVMSVVIGLVMHRLFGRAGAGPGDPAPPTVSMGPRPGPVVGMVLLLLALLVLGSIELTWRWRAALTLPLLVALGLVAWLRVERDYCRRWLKEGMVLILKIIPILIPFVLAIGWLAQKVPLSAGQWLAGGNSPGVNLLAAAFGALMYFPIMTEVAFVKMLLKVMGAGIGPGMAILLTGPGVSLPGMVILAREIGPKRTFCYVSLVVLLAALAGCFFGSTWGSYLCSCEFK